MTINTFIKVCEGIGTILTIIGAIMFSTDNHKIAGIWITFFGLVILLFALALYLQNDVLKNKATSLKGLKDSVTTVSEIPIIDISSSILTTINNSEVTVYINFTNLGKTTATDVRVYSGAILSPSPINKEFTTPYKNENKLSDIPAGVGKTMYHTSNFTHVPVKKLLQEKKMYFYIYGKYVYGNVFNKEKYIKHFSIFYNPDINHFIDVNDGKYPPDI
jgi:hypothetical protein